MIINPNKPEEVARAWLYIKDLIKLGKRFRISTESMTRSAQQNKALHKYFKFVSDALNELGLEFHYQGLIVENLSSRYTPNIVKEFIWRPIQIALFDIESTTKINTKQINEIVDVITKFFGDKGVLIEFPRKEFEYESK